MVMISLDSAASPKEEKLKVKLYEILKTEIWYINIENPPPYVSALGATHANTSYAPGQKKSRPNRVLNCLPKSAFRFRFEQSHSIQLNQLSTTYQFFALDALPSVFLALIKLNSSCFGQSFLITDKECKMIAISQAQLAMLWLKDIHRDGSSNAEAEHTDKVHKSKC